MKSFLAILSLAFLSVQTVFATDCPQTPVFEQPVFDNPVLLIHQRESFERLKPAFVTPQFQLSQIVKEPRDTAVFDKPILEKPVFEEACAGKQNFKPTVANVHTPFPQKQVKWGQITRPVVTGSSVSHHQLKARKYPQRR